MPLYAASKAAINMMTVHFGLSGGQGQSVHDGTDAIVAYALAAPGGPAGTFADRDGEVPW